VSESFSSIALRFQHGSLAEKAYFFIREQILRGDLGLGTKVSRRNIAQKLGMSIVPVSEALQRLETEGLVETTPRVGTRIYMPTPENVGERYVIREALESQSARLFSLKASSRERIELCRMAEHMDALFGRRLDARKDWESIYQAQTYHLQLHMRIAECGGCRPLVQLIEQTHVLVFNWVWDVATDRPALPSRFHRDLLDVLVGNDPEASDKAMRQHVQYGLDRVIRALQKQLNANQQGERRAGVRS